MTKFKIFSTAAVLATAASLFAGGFIVQVSSPQSNPEATGMHAVVVVRAYACIEPEKTTLHATAEGLVNGARRSIPLHLTPLREQNLYAITQQWPNEGKWVLSLVASNPKFSSETAAIVHVNGSEADLAGAMHYSPAPSEQQLQAELAKSVVASR